MIDNSFAAPTVSDETTKTYDASAVADRLNPQEVFHSPMADELSHVAVGKWNTLISRTNWEKGRIIVQWRQKLIEAGMPDTAYSDEAWTFRIRDASNNAMVSSRHIGRLRRVYERFGEVHAQYPTLYWSHFQAALTWEDAEMWLEGAVQNQWSVMQMRNQRWEALGAPAELKPSESEILTAELDEDVNPRNDSDYRGATEIGGDETRIEPADKAKGKAGEGQGKSRDSDEPPFDVDGETLPPTGEILRGLKSMEELPEDLREAFEQLKIAILNHKAAGFRDVDPQHILLFLNTMRQIVLSRDTAEG